MSANISRRTLLSAGAGAAVAALGGMRPALAAPVDERVLRAENSEGSYQSKFEELVRQGYRPYIIDGWETGQVSMLSAIFRPIGGIAWRARHGMNGDAFQADFDAAVRDGWRLTNVTSYLLKVDGDYYSRYASIWEKSPGPQWTVYHGVPRDLHQIYIDTLGAQGFVPVNLSCVVDEDGDTRVTGLYQKANFGSWVAKTMLTASEYQQLFDENSAAGRHLSYVNACQAHSSSNPYNFSAIFQSGAPGSGGTIAHHGVPNANMDGHVDLKNADGFLTRSIAGYRDGYEAKFAGVWRRP